MESTIPTWIAGTVGSAMLAAIVGLWRWGEARASTAWARVGEIQKENITLLKEMMVTCHAMTNAMNDLVREIHDARKDHS